MMIDQQKQDLRRMMRQRRAHTVTPPHSLDLLNKRLAASLLDEPAAPAIGCVWPLPGEPDLRPLCHALFAAGRDVFLPETTPRGSALLFRRWTPTCAMLTGRFGTMHPDGVIGRPDVLLVPLLAFDRSFNRLGYGGGYYDRTLAALGCRGIGFAFAWQEVAHVPIGPYDAPLDRIVTEQEIITPRAGKGKAE
ncbi:5-formyltetrahydrofolate cyclo-ligase [Asaia krungthepensis]|uniref:5-formyltetrahydrofolate cyclo-ligase n=1 Tax=Asaia krungthepensis NRIC 0535 TaxID=1307925 RepID=A0ABQ0PW29_9PROT|nr:5-formyltetrahydrofolate cyclo-ligase [Asaia krungthepensis]GBQ83030.1 5-formyltetrahydrofolate cyclo-ligase [Asaia krungthepensis NRIC 0535]